MAQEQSENSNSSSAQVGPRPKSAVANNKTNKNNNSANHRRRRRQSPQNKNHANNNSNTNQGRQQQQRKRKNNKTSYRWWKKHIPAGAVDPITLEPLRDLPYPPFALHAEPPYEPIASWPSKTKKEPAVASSLTQEQQRRRDEQTILSEQWGDAVVHPDSSASSSSSSSETDSDANNNKTPNKINNNTANTADRHVHLYDGHALAAYLISQLQFIDPLNRRDLTRDELQHLDRYLQRHQRQFATTTDSLLNVTQAYDAKGNSISRAGATAATEQGRAAMLQQEASMLLESLFTYNSHGARRHRGDESRSNPRAASGNSNPQNDQSPASPPAASNPLMDAYLAHEQREQETVHDREDATAMQYENDTGIHGDEDGILVIDDDINPGLRGTLSPPRRLTEEATDAIESAASNTTTKTRPVTFSVWSTGRLQRERQAPHLPPLPSSARAANKTRSAALSKLVVTPRMATTSVAWSRPN